MAPHLAPFRCMDCHIEPEGARWAVIRTRVDGSRVKIGSADTQDRAEGIAYSQAGVGRTDCHIT